MKVEAQRRTLWSLLAINGAMFVLEFVTGRLAQSMGLIADSLDMLADAATGSLSGLWVRRIVGRRTLPLRVVCCKSGLPSALRWRSSAGRSRGASLSRRS